MNFDGISFSGVFKVADYESEIQIYIQDGGINTALCCMAQKSNMEHVCKSDTDLISIYYFIFMAYLSFCRR